MTMKRAHSRRALLSATVLSLLLLSCRDAVTAPGKPAPGDLGFRLKTVDGRTIGPKDYEGKGVQFLAANVGEDEPTVRSFLKSKPFPYPVLLDPEDTVSTKLGVVA